MIDKILKTINELKHRKQVQKIRVSPLLYIEILKNYHSKNNTNTSKASYPINTFASIQVDIDSELHGFEYKVDYYTPQ